MELIRRSALRFLTLFITSSLFAFAISASWAANVPSWPKACLDLHQDMPGSVVVKRYNVAFDDQQAGFETFCIATANRTKTVYQWTSNSIHKFLGSTSIKHCRKEVWRQTGKDESSPSTSGELESMQAWTDVGTDGTHAIASFLDQVPKPSSIKAAKQSDGAYRYVLQDLAESRELDSWQVSGATLRTPWTEAMIPTATTNLMDPVRYRISMNTSVLKSDPDPSVKIPHRRYRIDGGDFYFTAMFRADDGTLLAMSGNDASAKVDIVLLDQQSDQPICPHPMAGN